MEVSHDLGRVMDRDTLRDVRSEIDRAHVMLSERRSQWAAVVEQFVDPNPKPRNPKKEANPKKEGGGGGGAEPTKEPEPEWAAGAGAGAGA